jgi:hypothetical protein
MSKKSRANKARRAVDRAERVPPSALAEAKKRRWSMTILLEAGREGGGLEADQYEAALEIVACYRAITSVVGYHMRSMDGLRTHTVDPDNPRVAETYRRWCSELQRRMGLQPAVIVGWVEDTARPIAVDLLARALDLWLQVQDDLQRTQRLTPTVSRVDCTITGHHLSASPHIAYAQAPSLSLRAVGQATRAAPARAQAGVQPAPPIVKR